jgi:hypothetical protein
LSFPAPKPLETPSNNNKKEIEKSTKRPTRKDVLSRDARKKK